MTAISLASLPAGPVVSAEWLAAHRDASNLRIIDIRGTVLPADAPPPRYRAKRADYKEGHIPGASFVDWTVDIVDLDDPIPSQVAPPGRFAAAMGTLGIGNDSVVIAYDDYSHMFAGRLHWALRYYGHESVRILEGGLAAWLAIGGMLTTDVPAVSHASFVCNPQADLRRNVDQVTVAIQAGSILVDARSDAQFVGTLSAAKRAGHIPSARNVPYPTLLTGPQGAFRPAAELRALFNNAGVPTDGASDIIVYCNGGISATVAMTALALVGVTNVALYDGSWSEWGNRDDLPIERGKAK